MAWLAGTCACDTPAAVSAACAERGERGAGEAAAAPRAEPGPCQGVGSGRSGGRGRWGSGLIGGVCNGAPCCA